MLLVSLLLELVIIRYALIGAAVLLGLCLIVLALAVQLAATYPEVVLGVVCLGVGAGLLVGAASSMARQKSRRRRFQGRIQPRFDS